MTYNEKIPDTVFAAKDNVLCAVASILFVYGLCKVVNYFDKQMNVEEARRSTRVSRAPERLEVTGRGKSYETTTNHSIGWNLHRSLSGGEGGITGSTDQQTAVIWRPWEWTTLPRL